MRKSIFLLSVLSLCLADFGAFAATARSSRATGQSSVAVNTTDRETQSASEKNTSTSARAASRKQVANVGARTSSPVSGAGTSVRAAKQPTAPKTGVVSARAGATQKVINTGTKVAVATENTAIPEECQNAFYGCMDAFCMLDNATGGRCQCSDQITELDAVLEDILRLDEQSYVMATEGVERIQMGEAEDQIMARAKAAGEKAVADNKESEANKRRVRTLDLSIFDNNIFNEIEGVDDILDSGSMQQTLVEKKGKALLNASNSMCSEQIPNECKKYNSMLSLVYAQKVKSDCMAYENSLKAQKNQSQQKLQTAQKALRDAALDEYKNQNKYATAGECAIAFAQCVQTTGECGEDYTGCVTFAARENMTNSSKSGSVAKQTRIKGTVSGADITLAASTMEQLLSKKLICESVVKQCVNANKNDAVWDLFLRNEAPALKSAELVAEQDLRSSCLPKAAECFKNSCKSQFTDDESYDACLSNPKLYMSSCKVELEPCLQATNGSFEHPENSYLWQSLSAMLNAMKVDTCTKEIKDCITDRCGKDYSECVGLTTTAIGQLCPIQELTACATDGEYADVVGGTNDEDIRAYVAQIAQGIALSIDNAMTKTCQNAVDEAMIKVCGDTETCEFSDGKILGTDVLKYQIKIGDGDFTDRNLVADNAITSDFETKIWGIDLLNKAELKQTTAGGVNSYRITEGGNDNYTSGHTGKVIKSMNNVLRTKLEIIESDPTVKNCMTGRTVEVFDSDNGFGTTGTGRFTNLLNSAATTIASGILAAVGKEYETEMAEIQDKIAKDKARFANISNQQKCEAYNRGGCKRAEACTYRRDAVYDSATSTCTVTSYREYCPYGSWAGEYCLVYKVTNTYVTTFVCNDAGCSPPNNSLFDN